MATGTSPGRAPSPWTWVVVAPARCSGEASGGNPSAHTTSYSYDALGDLTSVSDQLAHTTSYSYDPDQNLSSITDADGNQTTYSYDAANQLTTVTRADATTLTNGYDSDGNLTSQTDGAAHSTTYGYDPLDRLVSVTDPLSRTTTYAYDGAGNLTSVIDPKARKTTYGYDQDNRPTSISYSDGQTPNVSYGYDNDGQRTSMSDGTGTSSYSYDSLHRLTSTTDGAGNTIADGYDLAGNETSLTYPNGKTITRGFDAANRLSKVTDWLAKKTSFGYDPDSNLLTTTFPTQTSNLDSYSYNNADQLTAITLKKATSTLASLAYTRDPHGLLTAESQTGLPGAASTSYSYSKLNQLAAGGQNSYSYDQADNLTQLDGTSGYSYDTANELTSTPNTTLAYDQLGQRTSQTPTGANPTTYSYNQASELTKTTPPTGTPTTLTYNGDGLRTTKTTGTNTTSFTWDQTASIPLTLTDSQNSYIYGPEDLTIEQINQAGTPSYLHHDQLGTTRLITSQTGANAATFTYNPYGTLTASTGTATSPIGYAGQYTDPETGLQYDQARYYDPTTGQFLTRDPIAAFTRQPYTYTAGDPVNATDPSGLDDVPGGEQGAIGSMRACDQNPSACPDILNALNALNPIRYYEAEITAYENGCSYWQSVAYGLQGAAVAATDVYSAAKLASGLGVAAAEEGASAIDQAASKVPDEWGPGSPARSGGGWRWSDPNEKPGTNYIRVDPGNPASSDPLQQVDHVHVSSGGVQVANHLPLDEWLQWGSWNAP